jgi:alpha-galactosidase
MVALTKPEYSGAGTWADGDMLMVCNYGGGGSNAGGRGDGGMTLEEYRTSYSLWAVLASPIIISADLRTLASEHPDCLAMLKNKELIAISQDPLGMAGWLVAQATNGSDPSSRTAARHTNIVEQVFARKLSGGARAVALFNRGELSRNMSVSWSELGLNPAVGYHVRDIWASGEYGEDVGVHTDGYRAVVKPHAATTIRISPPA